MHDGTAVSGFSVPPIFILYFAMQTLTGFVVIRKHDYSIVILPENPPAGQILIIFLDLLELRNFRDQIVFLVVVASLLLPFANLLV